MKTQFEVIRWVVDEIPDGHLIAVRPHGASDGQFVCASVDRSEVHHTPAREACLCVDAGFGEDMVQACVDEWER